MRIDIEIGSKWENTNGHRYQVVLIANEFSTNEKYPITVIYQGANKKVWCKTLENFLAKMDEVI